MRAAFQSLVQRGATALGALAQGRNLRTVIRLGSAGVFKLPIVYGDLRPGMRPTIIDVGAARGESGRLALSVFPRAEIHSVEPIPSEFAALAEEARGFQGWRVYETALGASVGKRELHVCEKVKQASSLLPIGDATIRAWPEHDFGSRQTIVVPVTTLTRLVEDHRIDQIDILKLDVQGAELEVLHGARHSLARVRYIITEVAFQPMYQGGCLFPDVMAFLHEHGRYLRALAGEVRDKDGRVVQADALFG
jgi:FkbM family methyltransferase